MGVMVEPMTQMWLELRVRSERTRLAQLGL